MIILFKLFSVLFIYFFIIRTGASANHPGRKGIKRIDLVEGQNLTLSCTARPNYLRSYRWVYIREGTQKPRVLSLGRRLVIQEPRMKIDVAPNGDQVNLILTLKEIQRIDAGQFLCWRHGLHPDPQVFVRVLEAGTEEREPLSVELSAPEYVNYGSAITLDCVIRPSWPGKVLWFTNNREIKAHDRMLKQSTREETNGELIATLNIVSLRTSANFTCHVPSQPPTEASTSITVRVADIESLRLEPPKDEVDYGETLYLVCVASGTESKIVWLKDGGSLKVGDSGRVNRRDQELSHGRKESTLTIHEFENADNGQYVCYVPGDSQGVLVNIEGRQPKIMEVKGWNFHSGEALRLTCSTQYAKSEKNVTWLFEGEPLRVDWWAEQTSRDDIYNITYHDLSLPIPTRNHAGVYTCVTSFGSASTEVKEIIPPHLEVSPPVRVDVMIGEEVLVPCAVAGYPTPVVTWEKLIGGQFKIIEEAKIEGEPELEDMYVKTEPLLDGENQRGERQDIFISEAFPNHSGLYRCTGYNDDETVSVSIEIEVADKRIEIVNMTAKDAMETDTLEISCVISNWDGQVEFVHGLRALSQDYTGKYTVELASTEEKEELISLKSGKSLTTNNVLYTYVLYIANVTLHDQGFYECHAGEDLEDSIVVSISQIPPEVVEVAASPAVEGEDFFVSCTITNMPTDEQAIFYINGEEFEVMEDHERHSIHLAELTNEVVVDSKGKADLATYVLKVRSARQEDSGTYLCTIGSTEGSVDVFVNGLDSFEDITLEASKASVGDDLMLMCNVSGSDKEVTFLHNHTVMSEEDSSRIFLSRETDGNMSVITLTISNTTLDDEGLYQCFTSPVIYAEVNVTVEPTIVSESLKFVEVPEEELNYEIGAEVNLTCSVQGGSTTPFVSWYKQDTLEDIINGTQKAVITITSFNESHIGIYVCRVETPEEIIYAETNIGLLSELKIIEGPDPEITLVEESSATLRCVVLSFPPSEDALVTWTRKGNESILASGYETASYEIERATSADQGEYVCKAEIPGVEKFVSTQVEITRPEVSVDGDQNYETTPAPALPRGSLIYLDGPDSVEEGDTLILTCILNPLFAYYKNVLSFNGTMIVYDNELDSREIDPRMEVNLTTGFHDEIFLELRLRDVDRSDQGVYECTVNTDPPTRHFRFVKVISNDSMEVEGDTESGIIDVTASPDFWDSNAPFAFDDDLSHVLTSTISPTTEEPEKPSVNDTESVRTISVSLGESVLLECRITESDGPIAWQRKNSEVISLDEIKISDAFEFDIEVPDSASRNLLIYDVRKEDTGHYVCFQEFPEYNSSVHVNLEILEVDDGELDVNDTVTGFEETSNENNRSVVDYYDESIDDNEYILYPEEIDVDEKDYDSTEDYEYNTLTSVEDEVYTMIPIIVEETTTDDLLIDNTTKFDEFENMTIPGIISTTEDYVNQDLINNQTTESSTSYPSTEIIEEIEEINVDVSSHPSKNISSGRKDSNVYHHVNHTDSQENMTNVLNVLEYEDTSLEDTEDQITPTFNETTTMATSSESPETSSEYIDFPEVYRTTPITTTVTEEVFTVTPSISVETTSQTTTYIPVTTTIMTEATTPEITTYIPVTTTIVTETTTPDFTTDISVATTQETTTEIYMTTTSETETTSSHLETTSSQILTTTPETTQDTSSSDTSSVTTATTTATTTELVPEIEGNAEIYEEDEEIEIPVIVAVPGEDVLAPAIAEVVLPCPVDALQEDITWEDSEKVLFLGDLDLAGVKSTALDENGSLKLLSGGADAKDGTTYTCLVYDYDTFEDRVVVSYDITLEDYETFEMKRKNKETKKPESQETTPSTPVPLFDFPGFGGQTVSILSNTELSRTTMIKLLENNDMNIRLIEASFCLSSEEIGDFNEAFSSAKGCEEFAREEGFIGETDSVFVMIDFTTVLGPAGYYGSSLVYIHNAENDLTSHVYGALVPVNLDDTEDFLTIQCGSPVYASQADETEDESKCESSLKSTMTNLEEAYKTLYEDKSGTPKPK